MSGIDIFIHMHRWIKNYRLFFLLFFSLGLCFFISSEPPYNAATAAISKAKFYDFKEQLIDGEIKKPITLYTDARAEVKFERLLKLKKSFMNNLFDTAKERIFK
jgi:hypothetical protein